MDKAHQQLGWGDMERVFTGIRLPKLETFGKSTCLVKNFLILLAVGGLSILAYSKWQQWNTPPPPPTPIATPVPVVVATPMPPPKLPEKHLMPEGSFAILDYVSARTKTGIVGFEPGQPVRFVSADQNTGTLLVTDGTYQVAVKPEQLTNDLDVAAIARRRDQAGQAQLQSFIASAKDEDAKIHLQANIDAAKSVSRLSTGSTIGTSSTLSHGAQPATAYEAAHNELLRGRYPYGSPYYYLNR